MLKARFTQNWLDAHRVEMAQFDRSQVVGIGHAMAEVDSLLARLRDPERVAILGAVPPRGILFFGSPGTGKTHLARYLASQLGDGVNLYEIPSDELSPDRLRRAIRSLAAAPQKSVVFIDEADSWAVNRAFGTHTPATRLLLTSALSTLSGLVPSDGPIVVVATNRHPVELDPALIRSGRLGTHIFFDMPN
jgi:ATP-dependent 26S proteasome regulatory subunit